MLSLRQSIGEIDKAEAMRQAAAESFVRAVEASAENVVEVNPHDVAAFRQQILGLAAQLNRTVTEEGLEAARAGFRGGLRGYTEKASRDIQQLRRDVEAAATAMQQIAQNLQGSGENHQKLLTGKFRQLEDALQADDIRQIRVMAHDTMDAVAESFAELKQSHAGIVSQLQEEIRLLHEELARGQRRLEPPENQGVANKARTDKKIDELLRKDHVFGVVLLKIPDATELAVKYPRKIVDQCLAELQDGFAALTLGTPIADWGRGVFGAVLAGEANGSPDLDNWQRKLSVCHVFQQDGLPRTLRLTPRLEWVAHRPGTSPAVFFETLSSVVASLTEPQKARPV